MEISINTQINILALCVFIALFFGVLAYAWSYDINRRLEKLEKKEEDKNRKILCD
jgi:hypothetical protein